MDTNSEISAIHHQVAERIALVCPQCRQALMSMDDFVKCPTCNSHWPIVDNVPHFTSSTSYYGDIDRDRLNVIIDRMRQEYWKDVLQTHAPDFSQHGVFSIINPDRANWRLLVPLSSDSLVLDVGAEYGALTQALANSYRQVVAIEPTLEYIEFMRLRFQQELLSNVSLIRNPLFSFPLPDQSADLAIINDMQLSNQLDGERFMWSQALESIYRVLKIGGFVCMAVVNRWSLAGARHGAARMRHRRSVRYYIRLLQKLGFSDTQIFCVMPNYVEPKFIMPFDDDILLYMQEHFTSEESSFARQVLHRLLHIFGLAKYLVQTYFIVARK